MSKELLAYYLERYISGEISADEWKKLQQMIKEPEADGLLNEVLDAELSDLSSLVVSDLSIVERLRMSIGEEIKNESRDVTAINNESGNVAENIPVRKISPTKVWWAAAAMISVLCVAAYFWIQQSATDAQLKNGGASVTQNSIDIPPGQEGAILVLADGTEMILDSLENGIIANEAGAQIALSGNVLTYNSAEFSDNDPSLKKVQWNTLITPKGRQFSLALPDGTKVWLNAASSIRYPVVFNSSERRVEVTGEVYFEVNTVLAQTQNGNIQEKTERADKIPFIVSTKHQLVEVLGTHFNINAYENEGEEKTTLLEGRVKVSLQPPLGTGVATNAHSTLLKPGQQVSVLAATAAVLGPPEPVDVNKVMSWKNGLFNFEGATLKEVMKQLERWYDIEVVYEGDFSSIRLKGGMDRNVKLSDAIIFLTDMGIHSELSGKTLYITDQEKKK